MWPCGQCDFKARYSRRGNRTPTAGSLTAERIAGILAAETKRALGMASRFQRPSVFPVSLLLAVSALFAFAWCDLECIPFPSFRVCSAFWSAID